MSLSSEYVFDGGSDNLVDDLSKISLFSSGS